MTKKKALWNQTNERILFDMCEMWVSLNGEKGGDLFVAWYNEAAGEQRSALALYNKLTNCRNLIAHYEGLSLSSLRGSLLAIYQNSRSEYLFPALQLVA